MIFGPQLSFFVANSLSTLFNTYSQSFITSPHLLITVITVCPHSVTKSEIVFSQMPTAFMTVN